MSDLRETLKATATPENKAAMVELECRGFVFCVDFGIENSAARLAAMNQAMADGRLYEHLRLDLGR